MTQIKSIFSISVFQVQGVCLCRLPDLVLSIKCLPGKDLVGGRLHLDVATLVLDVGDDGDDEPEGLDWPAPAGALLLAGDTVLQGGGGHVLRPQSLLSTSMSRTVQRSCYSSNLIP